MANIFDYTDYRRYLADYYAGEKKRNPNFSYMLVANKAGFANKGFVYNIINGKKHLSRSHILKLATVIGLNSYETEYFALLVEFNQKDSFADRNYFYNKMEEIKYAGKRLSPIQVIRKDQYEYYSKWYHSAIRTILIDHDFTGDFKWLSKQLIPVIRPLEAKKSIQLLERLGLVQKNEMGIYRAVSKTLTTGPEVASVAVANFHLETIKLAQDALQKQPPEKRNITGLTLGISEPTYKKICDEIQEFQARLLKIAEMDENADRVCRINFQMFQQSKQITAGPQK